MQRAHGQDNVLGVVHLAEVHNEACRLAQLCCKRLGVDLRAAVQLRHDAAAAIRVKVRCVADGNLIRIAHLD